MTASGIILFWNEIRQNFLGLPIGWASLVTALSLLADFSLYALALIGLIWVAVALMYWFAPGMLAPRAIYVGLSSLMFTFAATLTLAAAIARDRGYRLTSRRISSRSGLGHG